MPNHSNPRNPGNPGNPRNPRTPQRIGELLARQGLLTWVQIDQVLEEQERVGRPFGDLAERMFGVGPEDVEQAWLEQYLSMNTAADLNRERFDDSVIDLLNRRQAWQFRVLPIRRESGELVVATTGDRLRRAVNFAWRTFDDPVYFLIAPSGQLDEHLMEHYPWPSALTLA